MDYFDEIKLKLEQFIRRYYLSALIKGAMLFFGFGLLYAFFWIIVESFFWFSSIARAFVFWSLVFFETVLFLKLLLIPFLRYLRIRSGINHQEASKIIGDFFPEVKDKLLNTIQLNNQSQSEFVIANIEQKTAEFKFITFKKAVRFKDNLRYLKYAILPVFVIIVIYTSGGQSNFEQSFSRVIDYKTPYSPPPPFQFTVLNNTLQTIEKTPFVLNVKIDGDVTPQQVQIKFDDQVYYLKKVKPSLFQYKFTNPIKNLRFQLSSGSIRSETYDLEVLKAPKILTSTLGLNFPSYTKINDKSISNFGDISVPEGTKLTWSLTTQATDRVVFSHNQTSFDFKRTDNQFMASKQLFSDLDYSIETNNIKIKSYETLSFGVRVVKDLSPTLNVRQRSNDAINEALFFYGQLGDDYGISSLKIHYYPKDNVDLKKTREITFDEKLEFVFQFPNQLELIPDTTYELFFEALDNKPFPKPNSTTSKIFEYLYKSEKLIQQEQLNAQKDAVQGLEKTMKSIEDQNTLVEELTNEQLQKNKLTFNDQEKIKDVLKRQRQQDEILKQFNEQMRETLEQFPDESPDPLKENLAKRLEEQEQRLKDDENKLKELEDLAKNIQEEGLLEKLQKLGQQSKNKQKSLQQMLELTKRYYLSKKMEQLKNRLEELSSEQQEMIDNVLNEPSKNQSKLNDQFDKVKDELEDLRAQNKTLTKPLAVPETQKEEESITNNLEEAKEHLEQHERKKDTEEDTNALSKAQKAQKKSTQKMMQLAQLMTQSMSGGLSQQLSEDIEMLRQILDNLLVFSFEQEDLMKQLNSSNSQQRSFASHTKKQMNLKTHFEHIDDSLFVVSLRQPMISENINEQISEAYFNIDQTLNALSENRDYQASASQQYTITATNNLASMLSDILSNLEMQMQPSPGQGEGDMQLPDIIMSQEELEQQAEQMKDGQKEGQQNPGKQNQNTPPEKGKGKDGNLGDSSNNGKPSESDQYGDPDESAESLYRLYQQQQKLRQQLEAILKRKGLSGQGKNTLKSMEKIEQIIVNQGVNSGLIKKMKALKYEFLKLEEAALKQGKSNQRQSQTSRKNYRQQSRLTKEEIKLLFSTQEVLNRKPLPLHQNIKKKVKHYFSKQNDQL